MPRVTTGPLVLTGGAEFMPGNEPQDRAFLAAAAGRPIYVVATAATDAGGVYLCGGDPGLVVELLRDTRAWGAVVDAWRNGAALGGSSAGAMAIG